MLIIKKYASRKLYDTELSKYITLKDVFELAWDGGIPFKVVSHATDEDITNSVLAEAVAAYWSKFTRNSLIDLIQSALF